MGEQLDLFSYEKEMEKNPLSNSTCVVMDGVCINITWEELFDDKKYDSLTCVTYVSSASFFTKAVGKYQSVRLIFGIEKDDVRKAFAESMCSRTFQEGTKFFENLSDECKQQLIDEKIEIRYSKAHCIIHSKFYLLKDSKTGDNRVIFGSANLSQSAFDKEIAQYEDIMVFNNSPLYQLYEERFGYIYAETEDYVPRETIEKYKEGKMVSFADFTPEEMTDKLIDILREENVVPVCNETILKYVQEQVYFRLYNQ